MNIKNKDHAKTVAKQALKNAKELYPTNKANTHRDRKPCIAKISLLHWIHGCISSNKNDVCKHEAR